MAPNLLFLCQNAPEVVKLEETIINTLRKQSSSKMEFFSKPLITMCDISTLPFSSLNIKSLFCNL